MASACELCSRAGGEVLAQTDKLRVVLVDDAAFPGFCRVIWQVHVREMTELSLGERAEFMRAVWQVEDAVRGVMAPDKINLASLGNMTPHLHWHVIPRYVDDSHFPNPVWGNAQRTPDAAILQARVERLPALRRAIARRFESV